MFIPKAHSRRTFLRGVTLALPLLESMVPALTPATGSPRRGAALRRHLASAWRGAGLLESAQAGKDFQFSFITKPLERSAIASC